MPLPGWVRGLWLGFTGFLAVAALAGAVVLLSVRSTHADRIYPNVTVADVALGGLPMNEAATALEARGDAIESSAVTFTYGGKSWSTTLRDIGVEINEAAALDAAEAIGREDSAGDRIRSTFRTTRNGSFVSLPMTFDNAKLDRWLDQIDRELGVPPRNAELKIDGGAVSIVPEVDGAVVDRAAVLATVTQNLQLLGGTTAELPVTTKVATVRATDLEPVKATLTSALSHPVQVTFEKSVWTLPAAEIAQFVDQSVTTNQLGGTSVTIGLNHDELAAWLEERFGDEIQRDPVDAEVGWNGEKLVSVEESVDGVSLDAPKLATAVEQAFFGSGGTVIAPVDTTSPEIDSKNLNALGITTLLGSGQSNYSGSSDGRATNVAVGASLLNGTLIPPHGVFSFNDSIGLIDEDKGFVEAQVIDGEKIGKDIGGGICQVSTTVFRAAFLAGMPITEWWPHRFRIGFYELDGWEPGLDASILQPTDDPATWADFKFENPSDAWMLVESWTDGVNVWVNLYGADLGYDVEVTGPSWGDKSQMLPPQEVVDDEAAPGTVTLSQAAGIGEELNQYRVVKDRDGNLLWERSFYTKYFPRGDIWKVSADMKGQAPIDPSAKFPPLPPTGVDSKTWVPGEDVSSSTTVTTEEWISGELQPQPVIVETVPEEQWTDSANTEWTQPADASSEWTQPTDATGEWTQPTDDSGMNWAPPADDGSWSDDTWTAPDDSAQAG
ncbi:MAG: VanW family protein [Thermomicrobiales bacterium]